MNTPPAPTTDAEPAAAAATPGSGQQRAALAPWFVLLLLLLVACGAGYYWISVVHRAEQATLATSLAARDADQARLVSAVEATAASLAEVEAAQVALTDRVAGSERARATLAAAIETLQARDAQLTLDWILAETEYLVFAAIQRLALERDAAGAAAALRAADTRVQIARHPRLLELRERLTADIAALEAVPAPEVEGLALYLAEAVTRVERLPTRPVAALETSLRTLGEEELEVSNWRGIARALWRDLVALVEIKDQRGGDEALFDPDLRRLLVHNLRLELGSARLAALRRDDAQFQAACTVARDLLARYYDTEDSAVQALVRRLRDAHDLVLAPPLPDLADSLDAVRALRAGLGAESTP